MLNGANGGRAVSLIAGVVLLVVPLAGAEALGSTPAAHDRASHLEGWAPRSVEPPQARSDDHADCSAHPPIEITERVGPNGFEWINPATGEQEPRPGSGVVGGSGTEQDPYVIEGWCIPIPLSGQAGIRLQGTRAHVRIAENLLAGQPRTTFLVAFPIQPGVWLENATNVTAEQNTATLNWGAGFYIDDAHEIRLEANRIQSSQAGIDISLSDHIVARANTIEDTGFSGISTWRSSHLTFEANTLIRDGVQLSSTTASSLVENVVEAPPGVGVLLSKSSRNELRGNTITEAGERGLLLSHGSEDVLVEGNRITESGRSGLTTIGLEEPATGIVIRNNTLEGNALYGIVLTETVGSVLEGNRITENHRDGILVASGVEGTRIEGNLIWANHRHGIQLDGDGISGPVQSTVVAHNSVQRNDQAGLRLTAATNTSISENNVTANDRGIVIESGAGSALHGNNIDANEHVGLDVHRAEEPVNATRNWWGCPDGPDDPACDSVEGPGVVDPWLTAPNPDAGADA